MKTFRKHYKHFRTEEGAKISVTKGYQDGKEVIIIRMQTLSDTPIYGWEAIKKFKGKTLYKTDSVYAESTFLKILHTLNEFNL